MVLTLSMKKWMVDMVEVSKKKLKKLETELNNAIRSLLWGGTVEAGWGECQGAATCFKLLKLFDLKIKAEAEVRVELGGGNIHDFNFIKGL